MPVMILKQCWNVVSLIHVPVMILKSLVFLLVPIKKLEKEVAFLKDEVTWINKDYSVLGEKFNQMNHENQGRGTY